MIVNDIVNLMDGFTNLRVMKYIDEFDRFMDVFSTSYSQWEDIPYDVADLEVTRISIDNNTLVLECE